MTSLLLVLLAADPAAVPAPTPTGADVRAATQDAAPAKTEVATAAAVEASERPAKIAPPIPPPDVPDEVTKAADESMGFLLFRTFVVMGLVLLLAWVSINWGLRRVLGIKAPSGGGGVVHVIERVPLDQRHSLFVVKAAGEYLLVGGSEGSLDLISKLDTAEVDKLRAERPAALTLSPLLQKLLARKGTK